MVLFLTSWNENEYFCIKFYLVCNHNLWVDGKKHKYLMLCFTSSLVFTLRELWELVMFVRPKNQGHVGLLLGTFFLELCIIKLRFLWLFVTFKPKFNSCENHYEELQSIGESVMRFGWKTGICPSIVSWELIHLIYPRHFVTVTSTAAVL